MMRNKAAKPAESFPWSENACAVRRMVGGGEAALVAEGSLLGVARAIAELPSSALNEIRVSLPDRRVMPRSFDGTALTQLLAHSELEMDLRRLRAAVAAG